MIFIGIFLVSLVGYTLTLSILKEASFFERAGLSFTLGIGLLSYLLFVANLFGFGITLSTSIVVLLLILLVGLLLLSKNKISLWDSSYFHKVLNFSAFDKILIVLIVCSFAYNLLLSVYWPISDWDSIALYDFRAKAIYDTGSIVEAASEWDYFLGYPPLTSLAHTFVYQLGYENPKFIYPLFYLSLALVFYGVIRKYVSRRIALLATLVLAFNNQLFYHASVAYTNLPYTFYFFGSSLYLYLWVARSKIGYLVMSALLLALSVWTRISEPFWLVNLSFVLGYSLYKKKLKDIFIYIPIVFVIYQSWKNFESRIIESSLPSFIGIAGFGLSTFLKNLDLIRVEAVTIFLFRNIIKNWELTTLLAVTAVILGFLIKKGRGFLLLLIGNLALLFLGTYVFSIIYPGWIDIPESAVRMSMFFLPFFIFYTGVVIQKARN